ncbi:general transcription factor 3C polypeptide 2 isoform X2 [Strix uralensis]|uniref:general transcription factor 3C polypeptide 2 isoform X2 n=1 Tax=Strix uralensis TaxID=36305 RepID=UPI003DA7252F
MASSSPRGPRCRERSRRGRSGRGSAPAGRSRSRSRAREGEPRALRQLSPLGDLDALAPSEEGVEAAKSQKKPVQNQKPKSSCSDQHGAAPAEAAGRGEPSRTSENGPVPPPKAPGKRGRKAKTEMLLLKLSQDLECPAPEPLCVQKMLGGSEAPEGLEPPPGGRPKRRAAKVALLYLQELAEELTSVYQPPAPAEGAQEPEPELERIQKKRRSQRRKEEEMDSDDPARDADFVPSKEVLLQAEEEEEGSDAPLSEVSEPELETLRGHGGKASSAGARAEVFTVGVSRLDPFGAQVDVSLRQRSCPVPAGGEVVSSLLHPARRHRGRWCLVQGKQVQLPAAPRGAPGRLLLRWWPRLGHGVVPIPGGLGGLSVRGRLLPRQHGGDTQRGWAPRRPRTPAALGPGRAAAGAGLCRQSQAGLRRRCRPRLRLGHEILPQRCLGAACRCQEAPADEPAGAAGRGLLGRQSGAVLPPTPWRPAVLQEYPDGSFHKHLICKAQSVATLQVGSIQAGNASECGQCFSLSWMPSKPHHHLAAGFYDGTVAVWNLLTKSLLQCVRQPDGSLKLYPFQCFLAHDHAVRSIEWCKADSNFLVTAGSDRKIKFWDLRRLYEPINSIKRFLSTEVAWLLPYNGVTVAQDNCYASYGLCGIHYIDAGYLGFKAYFVAPRKGTVWSISGSDWLNTVAAGDITGELVAAVLPDLAVNPLNVKRSSDRRFPVYKADLLPCSPEGPEGGEQAMLRTRLYSEMVTKSYIRFWDTDLRSFRNFPSREPMRRMHAQEAKAELSLDRLQLEALHKVRFSPNLDSQGWLVSGGQAGIVRAHCLAGLASGPSRRLLPERRARFRCLYGAQPSSPGPPGPPELPAE